jgi:AAA+ ATPase superfamily predicted ATPase
MMFLEHVYRMKLSFLNRQDEQRRLCRALASPGGGLAVLYGRRRCGKSTLIQHVATEKDLYFLADQRDAPLQIQALAAEGERLLPGLGSARYRSWDALLNAIQSRASGVLNVLFDEFPYLVQNAPELPSMLQHYLDAPGRKTLNFLLCGSSQRMMQGLVLDRTAPLYGRAQEILRIEPLRAGWIVPALGLQSDAAVEAFGLWGGVPHYWELARPAGGGLAAARELVLDCKGVLHEEPSRLLLDDARTTGQPYSLLSLIGGGCHRLSEIAGRMGKPAGSLARPLANLIELGYVRRDVPFGEDARSGKRTLYALRDPFLRFHFRFVQPHRSMLELGLLDSAEAALQRDFGAYAAGIWEDLARESVPFLKIAGRDWGPASRWWGRGNDGQPLELDVVAESLDRKALLIGEAKWIKGRVNVERLAASLNARIDRLPFVRGRAVVPVLWLRKPVAKSVGPTVIPPDRVLSAVR